MTCPKLARIRQDLSTDVRIHRRWRVFVHDVVRRLGLRRPHKATRLRTITARGARTHKHIPTQACAHAGHAARVLEEVEQMEEFRS